MSVSRIRVTRDTPVSGDFEWVTLDRQGAVLGTGFANLDQSPVTGDCELVLASGLVSLEKVDLPPSQQKRLGSALRYLVEDFALADPEQLHVAAAPGPDKNSLCLAILDRQWLRTLLQRLSSARLVATSAYPESLLPALAPRTWTVVWSNGEGFVRTDRREALVLDQAGSDHVPAALQLALVSARAAGSGPQALVVRSAPPSAPPDLGAWAEALDLPVEEGPDWRWASAQPRPDFELLQGEFAARGTGGSWPARLRRPMLIAVALLILNSAALALDWGAKVRERNALREEMRALYRETFGQGAVVVDAPLQMRRALADLRRQTGHVGAADFIALLGGAAELLPPAPGFRVESIAYENAALTVSLRTASGQQAASLIEQLRAKSPPPRIQSQMAAGAESGTVVVTLRPGGS